jgi:hypothetical protein
MFDLAAFVAAMQRTANAVRTIMLQPATPVVTAMSAYSDSAVTTGVAGQPEDLLSYPAEYASNEHLC